MFYTQQENVMSTYKRLTLDDRLYIYEQLKKNTPVKDIANAVGVTISAIYYELKKGCENGEYNPYYADNTTKQLQKTKGAKNLIEGEIAQIISNLILSEKLSPEKIIVRLQEMQLETETPLSKTTIYSAIDKGLIPNVTREDLFAYKTTTHMFSDGLLHIPQWIRQELDIEDGTELSIEIKDNKIVIGKGNLK